MTNTLMDLAVVADAAADFSGQFAYWDIFVGKLGAMLAGVGLAIGVWAIWTVIAALIFRRQLDADAASRGRWVMVLSGLLGVATCLFFGLVLMTP